jgi:hypothetical protein
MSAAAEFMSARAMIAATTTIGGGGIARLTATAATAELSFATCGGMVSGSPFVAEFATDKVRKLAFLTFLAGLAGLGFLREDQALLLFRPCSPVGLFRTNCTRGLPYGGKREVCATPADGSEWTGADLIARGANVRSSTRDGAQWSGFSSDNGLATPAELRKN